MRFTDSGSDTRTILAAPKSLWLRRTSLVLLQQPAQPLSVHDLSQEGGFVNRPLPFPLQAANALDCTFPLRVHVARRPASEARRESINFPLGQCDRHRLAYPRKLLPVAANPLSQAEVVQVIPASPFLPPIAGGRTSSVRQFQRCAERSSRTLPVRASCAALESLL